MASSTAGAARVSKSINKAFRHRPWVHALAALFVGVVFGFFLRIVAIAALLAGGGLILIAALIALVAAIGFGALGRAFTGRRGGWWLAITVFAWAPAVIGAAFVVFASEGQFNQSNVFAPLVGGVVAGLFALLAYRRARWFAIVAYIAAIIAIIVIVVAAP